MKHLLVIAIFIALCSCNSKSGLTERIMALKDSCSKIDVTLDTLKSRNEARLNAIFHPSEASGVDKLLEDSDAILDSANQQAFQNLFIEYAGKRDSLTAIKKRLLRQIDSLQLKLQE